jgi:hypothetical protein
MCQVLYSEASGGADKGDIAVGYTGAYREAAYGLNSGSAQGDGPLCAGSQHQRVLILLKKDGKVPRQRAFWVDRQGIEIAQRPRRGTPSAVLPPPTHQRSSP